jgi:hypothetical protein
VCAGNDIVDDFVAILNKESPTAGRVWIRDDLARICWPHRCGVDHAGITFLGRGALDFTSRLITRKDLSSLAKRYQRLAAWVEIRCLHWHFFIPVNAQPRQVASRLVDGLGLDSRMIEILNTQDERPVVLPCQRPVDQECAGIAKMQGARWRGG